MSRSNLKERAGDEMKGGLRDVPAEPITMEDFWKEWGIINPNCTKLECLLAVAEFERRRLLRKERMERLMREKPLKKLVSVNGGRSSTGDNRRCAVLKFGDVSVAGTKPRAENNAQREDCRGVLHKSADVKAEVNSRVGTSRRKCRDNGGKVEEGPGRRMMEESIAIHGVLHKPANLNAEANCRVGTSKRKYRDHVDHGGDVKEDPDWGIMQDSIATQPKKKVKINGKKSNNKKVQKSNNDSMEVVPDLPERFRRVIREMQGISDEEPVLVIQKRLFATDLDHTSNRLSVPVNQVRKQFVTPDEYNSMNNNAKISVDIIEPSLQVSDINLTRWKMAKSNGRVNYLYVFITTWNALRNRNGLRLRDLIQLWAFRKADGTFALALVKVGDDDVAAGGSSSSSGSHGNSNNGSGTSGGHGGQDGNTSNEHGSSTGHEATNHDREDGNGNGDTGRNGSSDQLESSTSGREAGNSNIHGTTRLAAMLDQKKTTAMAIETETRLDTWIHLRIN